MSGASYNKKIVNKNKGQILIIILMLVGTIITIIFSMVFKSNIDTQLTKLTEENQKALAAAQAGIEEVLRKNTTVTIGSDILPNSGISGQAIIENLSTQEFTTPLLKKDEEYTFYLANYNESNNSFTNYFNSNLTICFNDNQALELTLIRNDGAIKQRYVLDSQGRINNAAGGNSGCPTNSSFSRSYNLSQSDIGGDSIFLIIRNLFNQGRIYFYSSTNLPLQGRTIISTAKTQAGIEKKVLFFQSYPQIPTEFFLTSF